MTDRNDNTGTGAPQFEYTKNPSTESVPRFRRSSYDQDRSDPGSQAWVRYLMKDAEAIVRHGWRICFMHAICTPMAGRWAGQPHCSCLDPSDPETHPGDCEHPGKHPKYRGWQENATTNLYRIYNDLMRDPFVNFGIATGQESNLVVLDIDRHGFADGMDTVKEWEAVYGPIPLTVRVLTGGGGVHFYFRYPNGHHVPSRRIAAGIDIKADGGIVLADGARHASGKSYAYDVDCHPDDIPVAEIPAWLLAKLLEADVAEESGGRGPWSRFVTPEVIELGRRNEVLFKRACSLRARCFERDDIVADLLVTNAERCRPKLSDRETRRIGSYVARRYPAGTPPKVVVRAEPVTDLVQKVTDVNERYLSDISLDAHFIYVVSPMDTGKTTAIARLIRANPGMRVLVLAHRITLARAWKGVLKNLDFLLYLDQDRGMLQHDRVIVSLDSIHRVCGEFDLVVIDESQQFLAHLDAATLGPVESPLGQFGSLLAIAKHVVAADADMDALTVNTLRRVAKYERLTEYTERAVVNRYQPRKKVVQHERMESLDAFRRERWVAGDRLAISCTTRSNATRVGLALGDEKDGGQATEIYQDMLADRPHAKVLLITNDTITSPDVVAFLHDPGVEAAKYDAIVYSPSMGTGVNVDTRDHFHHILGYCHGGTFTTASAALQGLARVRNPISEEMHVWLGDFHLAEVSHEHFRSRLLIPRDRDRKIALKHLRVTPWGYFLGEAVDECALDTLADIRYHRAIEQDGFIGQIRARWADRGTEVRVLKAPDNALIQAERETRRALREVITKADADAIVTAPDISPATAAEVENDPEAAPEMRRAALKARIKRFFGIPGSGVELTAELVIGCTKHHLMDQVRRFADILAIQEGLGEQVAKAALAAHEAHGLKTRPGIDPLDVIVRLLALYGIISLKDVPTELSVVDNEHLTAIAAMDKDLREALDIKVPADLGRKPFQLLSTILRHLGLKGKSKRDYHRDSGTDGSRIYRDQALQLPSVPVDSSHEDWTCGPFTPRKAPIDGYLVDRGSINEMLTLSSARYQGWFPPKPVAVMELRRSELEWHADDTTSGFADDSVDFDESSGDEEWSATDIPTPWSDLTRRPSKNT